MKRLNALRLANYFGDGGRDRGEIRIAPAYVVAILNETVDIEGRARCVIIDSTGREHCVEGSIEWVARKLEGGKAD